MCKHIGLLTGFINPSLPAWRGRDQKRTYTNIKMKNNLKNLAEDIIASYDARVKVVGEIIVDTHKILDGFRGERQEMSDNLREVLAKSESLRKKDFNAMMQDILLTQYKREENVKKMLADFREEEARVAERLGELLKGGEKLRLADFKKTLGRIRKDQVVREANTGEQVRAELATMQREVYAMLEAFKKEREAAASEWGKVRELFAEKGREIS
ncbi:MAG: hypothetical protein Q8P35_02375 [Candidatus Yanofskybacteria bacterium]|nr:hypothetical protein [Candidatus Yanofskybacteria bacterium]